MLIDWFSYLRDSGVAIFKSKILKNKKISLVIEGGGFKSVFSAGVLDAFLINQFNPFDIYIGVSSGAMCLSYYLANQYKAYFSLSSIELINKFV